MCEAKVAFPSFWNERRAGCVLDSHMTKQIFFSPPFLSKRTCKGRTFDLRRMWRNVVWLGHSVTLIMCHGFNAWAFLKPFKNGRINPVETQRSHNWSATSFEQIRSSSDWPQESNDQMYLQLYCLWDPNVLGMLLYKNIHIEYVNTLGMKVVKMKNV